MQDETVIFEHDVGTPATRWVEFTLPNTKYGDDEAVKLGDFTAFKVKNGGQGSLFAARVPLEANSKTKFEISRLPSDREITEEFSTHPLLADKPEDLIPTVSVQHPTVFGSGSEKSTELSLTSLDMLESNPARTVWFTRHSSSFYHVDTWYTLYSGDPTVRLQTQFVWMDNLPNEEFRQIIKSVRWVFGEEVHSDFAEAEGFFVEDGVLEWSPPDGEIGMAEIYRFDGFLIANSDDDNTVLTAPSTMEVEGATITFSPVDPAVWNEEDLNTITSVKVLGPIHGVYSGWNGEFLAFGATPEQFDGGDILAESAVQNFELEKLDNQDLFRVREFASNLIAHSAGAQNSFGTTKGGEVVTALRPRLIRALCFSMADEALRPIHYREPTGAPIQISEHPDLRTVGRVIHFNSKDKLGKASAFPKRSVSGRTGHQETHVASCIHAYIALTLDYQAEQWLQDMLTAELAAVRPYVGWMSPTRGQGRVAQFYANTLVLFPEAREQIEAIMTSRVYILVNQWTAQRVMDKFPDREILTVQILKDARWIQRPNGDPEWAFSPWEHAKCAQGHYAIYKQTEGDLSDTAKNIAFASARTVVNCYVKYNDVWHVPYAIRYYVDDREGTLPELRPDNWEVHWGSGGWVDWTLAAVKLYVQMEMDKNSETYAKAQKILSEVPAPTGWITSEWRAM